jgi:hypothetical protein
MLGAWEFGRVPTNSCSPCQRLTRPLAAELELLWHAAQRGSQAKFPACVPYRYNLGYMLGERLAQPLGAALLD